jgi:transketolase
MKSIHINKNFKLEDSIERCRNYRKRILDISQKVSALHAGGAFSCAEILDVIYYGLMRKKNKNEFIDDFILSKGHSSILQYLILNDFGFLSDEDIDLYCKPGGKLGCHPDYGVPGIGASTGSLGHGMGIATGIAQSFKISNSESIVYLVISDGELQEGSTWEAMMMVANLNLDNIICILDHNGSQSFGSTKDTHPKFYPIREKIESFNWQCFEVNGHSQKEICSIFNQKIEKKPLFIICNTVKGKGISFMENQPIWHYRSPSKEQYKLALKELGFSS